MSLNTENRQVYPATVRKNSKILRHVLENIVSIRDYDLANGFSGRECDALGSFPELGPWGWLHRDIRRFDPKFRLDGPSTLTVKFHSNSWLRIQFNP